MRNKGFREIELDGVKYRVSGARPLKGTNLYTVDAFKEKNGRLYPVEGVQKLDRLARIALKVEG